MSSSDDPLSKPPQVMKAPAPRERATRIRWLVFTLACGTSWMLYLHRYTWNFIRPQLQDEYGLSNTQLEGVYTIFNLSYAVGQVPSGILCDFFGLHIFLFLIILLWSIVLPMFGMAGGLRGLGSCQLMFGACQAGCYPSLTKVTRNWFPRSTRTIVQGLVASFFGRSGGAMSSIIMGTVLMGWLGLGWRLALGVLSVAGIAYAGIFFALFRNSPEEDPRVNQAERDLIRKGEEDRESKNAPRVLPFRRVLRSRTMLFFVFQQFMSAGADFIYVALMGTYFIKAHQSTTAAAGLLASLPLWGGALGGVAGGFLNDALIYWTGSRRWARTTVGFTGKLMACVLVFVAIAQTNSVLAAALLFVVKFFSDWSQPTVWGTCSDIGGRYTATVFSIINTAGSIGGIVTPLIVGVLLDRFTTISIIEGVETAVTNYSPMFVLVAVMYSLAAFSWLLIDCTKRLEE